jgi:hypothetical protein
LLDLDARYVEQICRIALSEPDRHAALRFLQSALETIETPLPGLRNEGLVASHAVEQWVKGRHESAQKARRVLAARGHELMRTLGYEVQPLAGPVSVLLAGPRKMAIAAFLDRTESPDLVSTRFSGVSPASYALSRAGDEGLDWVIVTAGEMLRLYPVRPGIGVGRRGRSETFVELHLGLSPDLQAALLWDPVFRRRALALGGARDTA